MKTALRTIVILAILGGFGYTMYYLWAKSEEPPVIYETTTASVQSIIKKTVATGSILPKREVDIKPRVSGIIEKIFVVPGQMINKGDAVAQIRIIPNMVSLNNAKSRVEAAKIYVKDVTLRHDQSGSLYEKGVIALTEYQRLQTELNTAAQDLLAAENNLQLIKEGALKGEGANSNTIVRSTTQGMVLDVPVKEGHSVIESNTFNEGTSIAQVANMAEMMFEGKVDESEVGKIKEGMALLIKVGAIDNEQFDATLEYISPKGVNDNGAIQFTIRANVTLKEDVFIRSGYSANADIVLDRRDSVLALSESLLIMTEDTDTIYIEVEKGDQEFEKVEVEVGLSDGINIEILNGVDAETKIKKQS
ncbi:MAG: HlyD family secretion protein [Granulosicoccus sp.]|jgi:HlyD family secretion protein